MNVSGTYHQQMNIKIELNHHQVCYNECYDNNNNNNNNNYNNINNTHKHYNTTTTTTTADIKNIGGKGGGSITAALFLEEFVEKAKWAHIDMAGPVWDNGATGWGVKTLVDYLLNKK